MITEKAFRDSARIIGCDTAAVKAVAKVESGGSGFLASGEPVILFEPHIYFRELKKIDIDPLFYMKDPQYADIIYPVWGTKPYGPSSKQHERLARAASINRDAALKSASYGKFQILGVNYKMCGCKTIQEFVNAMYKSEDEHLRLFTNYILSAGLDDELRYKDWRGFARGYNGPLFARNSYDKKMANAYNSFV